MSRARWKWNDAKGNPAHRLSPTVESNVLLGTEGARSLMGLVNGLSFAAHTTDGLQDEDRIRLESLAGDFFGQVMKETAAVPD